MIDQRVKRRKKLNFLKKLYNNSSCSIALKYDLQLFLFLLKEKIILLNEIFKPIDLSNLKINLILQRIK